MAPVLLVDGNPLSADIISGVLASRGHATVVVRDHVAALTALYHQAFAVVVVEYPLAHSKFFDFLAEVRNSLAQPQVIVVSAFAKVEEIVELFKAGIADFLEKPYAVDVLAARIDDIVAKAGSRDNRPVKGSARRFLTVEKSGLRVIQEVQRIAPFDTSVLILGESGCGKEVIARLIHAASKRRDGPFLAVNCAAIPSDLLESEFFGHEAGAFTGASHLHIGVFERAAHGTLFLDEIGEMPLLLQVKLLRALQEREIQRVGGTSSIRVQPRIIAATNRPITEAIKSGRLREDLYYRLATVEISIPPLRERPQDIDVIVDAVLADLYEKFKRSPPLTPEARRALRCYSWPGNVRELENVLERAVLLAEDEISEEYLYFSSLTTGGTRRSLAEIAESALRRAESQAIVEALLSCRGNKRQAARELQVSYKTLLNKAREYGL